MIYGIYTVKDEASALFMPLQVNENNDVALRSFDYALQSNQLMQFRPEDFSLWYLADFDNETGIIEPKGSPLCLKRGVKRGKR